MSIPLLLLAACAAGPDGADTAPRDTGSGAAYGCVEESRAALDDTTVPADGMSAAPRDIEAVVAGPWAGTFTFIAGGSAPATFDVAGGGTWEFVVRSFYAGGMGGGADPEGCEPVYAWTTTLGIADETGALADEVPVVIEAGTPWSARAYGTLPLEAVRGSTRPTTWSTGDWPGNDLGVSGTAEALDISGSPARGSWDVTVMWYASSEADAKDEAGTGTVVPSGRTEGVGTGYFTPG